MIFDRLSYEFFLLLLDDDERGWRAAVAIDGCQKLDHFGKCAVASSDIPPHINRYFGSANSKVGFGGC